MTLKEYMDKIKNKVKNSNGKLIEAHQFYSYIDGSIFGVFYNDLEEEWFTRDYGKLEPDDLVELEKRYYKLKYTDLDEEDKLLNVTPLTGILSLFEGVD